MWLKNDTGRSSHVGGSRSGFPFSERHFNLICGRPGSIVHVHCAPSGEFLSCCVPDKKICSAWNRVSDVRICMTGETSALRRKLRGGGGSGGGGVCR